MYMSGLEQLKELSKYLSNLESELSCFWQLSPSLLCLTKKTTLTKINPAWSKTLGYSLEELKNRSFFDFVHPEDIKKTTDAYNELVTDKKIVNFTNRYIRKDGKIVHLNWNGSYDANTESIYAVAQDVSEEITLKEHLLLNRKAIEYNGNCVVIAEASKEKDYPVVYVNPAFESTTGYSKEEVIGKNCRFLQGNLKNQLVLKRLRECLISHERFEGVVINFRKNGEMFYNKTVISPIFNENGICTHYVSSQYDATKEIHQIKSMLESEQRMKSILNVLPIGVFLANKNGDKRYVNQKWLEFVGLEGTQQDTLTWDTALRPEDIPELRDKWEIFINQGKGAVFTSQHYYINQKTKENIAVKVTANMVDDNSIIGYVEQL